MGDADLMATLTKLEKAAQFSGAKRDDFRDIVSSNISQILALARAGLKVTQPRLK